MGPLRVPESQKQSVRSTLGTNCSILFFFFFFRIMSPVKNNVGRGLNIALVNGELLTHPPDSPDHALSTGGGRYGEVVNIHSTNTGSAPTMCLGPSCSAWEGKLVGTEGLKDLVQPTRVLTRPLPCAAVPGGYASPVKHDPILKAMQPKPIHGGQPPTM